ncbi:Uncharacterised protein [Vibrio cholerae]|nr:Uncharacterised protein [Vibrio cholerae]
MWAEKGIHTELIVQRRKIKCIPLSITLGIGDLRD